MNAEDSPPTGCTAQGARSDTNYREGYQDAHGSVNEGEAGTTGDPRTDALRGALEWVNAGVSVIPIRADGSKRPAVRWKPYQGRVATTDELRRWFSGGCSSGVGAVCGAVSGNLLVMDFDAPGAFQGFREAAGAVGLSDVLACLVIVETPSGGHHAYLRSDASVACNEKLADALVEVPADGVREEDASGPYVKHRSFHGGRARIITDEHGAERAQVTTIETRGEAGYVVAPGSPVACHELGRPYVLRQGEPSTIPVLPSATVAALLSVARALDSSPPPDAEAARGDPSEPNTHDGYDAAPGRLYNARATVADVAHVLAQHGWTDLGFRGMWRRPGKTGPGASARLQTWNDRTVFCCFSTSASPPFGKIPKGRRCAAFGPFDVLVHLQFGGDFAAAARWLAQNGYRDSAPEGDGGASPRESASAAHRLIGLAADVEFFRDERETEYARVPVNGHTETWPVRSKKFAGWLRRKDFGRGGKLAGKQAVEDAINQLAARAQFEGAQHTLAVRFASTDQATWLDLANDLWSAVRITRDGWSIENDPPPLFRRHAVNAPQVDPQPGGSIDALRPFLNVRDENTWRLVVAFLVASYFPDIPHPVLIVHGEQGSAKSTACRVISLLVDPSRAPLRSLPRNKGEWVQAADHSAMLCLDNVSDLPIWLSDAICRAVTGDGDSKRALYTDDDDIIYSFRRIIALTGIDAAAQRPDVLDRSVVVELDPIAEENRKLDSVFTAGFERERPRILGALLDIVSGVLRALPDVHLTSMPRMADFARIGVAVERVLGWPDGSFLGAYGDNRAKQNEEALGTSPVGDAVVDFVRKHGKWEGTATELLVELTPLVSPAPQDWPKKGNVLSGHLKRIAPNLRALGIEVEYRRERNRRVVTLTVRARAEDRHDRHDRHAGAGPGPGSGGCPADDPGVEEPAGRPDGDDDDGRDGADAGSGSDPSSEHDGTYASGKPYSGADWVEEEL